MENKVGLQITRQGCLDIGLLWCNLNTCPCLEDVDIEDIDVKIAELQMILTL